LYTYQWFNSFYYLVVDMESKVIKENSPLGKARVMLLWLAIGSICMMFGGFTSAYIVSRGSKGWLTFELPSIFFISTVIILLSSASMIYAFNGAKNNRFQNVKIGLALTFVLGLVFCYFQFEGWGYLIDKGIYFMGSQSKASGSYLYLFTLIHLLHIVSGLLVLLYCFVKSLKNNYKSEQFLGLKMASVYWHFLDLLWVFLFLFLYFIR
jgi:cytochrome c oxidase subunit III